VPIRALDLPARGRGFRDPEIQNLNQRVAVTAVDAKEVRGFEVAMHDAERVALANGFTGLQNEVDDQTGFETRQRAVRVFGPNSANGMPATIPAEEPGNSRRISDALAFV
jgi:hypothetical protein